MNKVLIRIILVTLLLAMPLIIVLFSNFSSINNDLVNNSIMLSESDSSNKFPIINKEGSAIRDPNIKDEEYDPSPNVKPTTTGINRSITIYSFLENIDCISITLNKDDTLTTIANKYTSTCNPETTINILKIVNDLDNIEHLDVGTTILVPHYMLKSGSLYKVSEGNTWNNIWKTKYSQYDQSQLIKFLISLNNLPDGELPIGEKIFLPVL